MYLPAGVCVHEGDLDLFKNKIHPAFQAERLILVTNQFGHNKVSVYAMGHLEPGKTVEDIAAAQGLIPSGCGRRQGQGPARWSPRPRRQPDQARGSRLRPAAARSGERRGRWRTSGGAAHRRRSAGPSNVPQQGLNELSPWTTGSPHPPWYRMRNWSTTVRASAVAVPLPTAGLHRHRLPLGRLHRAEEVPGPQHLLRRRPRPRRPARRPDGGGSGEGTGAFKPLLASTHKPFVEEKCDACHAGGSGAITAFASVTSDVCLKCHTGTPHQYPMMHGPVAVTACLWCHNPHESNQPSLLKAPRRAVHPVPRAADAERRPAGAPHHQLRMPQVPHGSRRHPALFPSAGRGRRPRSRRAA